METVPKSMRLHIALFGRANVGKSSLLNLIANQDVSITSPVAGTTTDVVEKSMELLPIGPVVFHDTAGLDDSSELGARRVARSKQVFQRADVAVIVCEADRWGTWEEEAVAAAKAANIAVIAVISKIDLHAPSPEFIERVKKAGVSAVLPVSGVDFNRRDEFLGAFKQAIIAGSPDEFINSPPLIGDLVKPGDAVVLIVPIDLQAPKGRLILPQVQTIRDALDHDCPVITVKETGYQALLRQLGTPPALVICDSQVVDRMVAETPPEIPCTTFSILLSRLKGDMTAMARGAAAISALKNGDRVLIAEACSHHATQDDIGRVKIPGWLRNYAGADLNVQVYAGRDYPENLSDYRLIIHCGGCMFNRREILSRIQLAEQAGVPITNYGMCISFVHGVLERVMSPFPAALAAFRAELSRQQP